MRRRRLTAAVALVLGTLVITGGLAAVFSGRHHYARHNPPIPQSPTSTTPSVPASSWRRVAPATIVPADTPVQQQYDEGFETGFSSGATKAMMARADSLELPSPAIGGGWPQVPASQTPEGWAADFVRGLFDVDFAHQRRIAVAAWLVEPRDIRAAVEDVAGTLTVADGKTTTRRRFSVVVEIGSARWRAGYGTVLVSDWKES